MDEQQTRDPANTAPAEEVFLTTTVLFRAEAPKELLPPGLGAPRTAYNVPWLRRGGPYGEPHLMTANGAPVEANSCVASLGEPLDAGDFHHLAAAARRPLSGARS